MAIVINCTCGQTLRAKDETAGKKSKCPHCGAVVSIPMPTAVATATATAAAPGAAAPVAPDAAGHAEAMPIDLAWPSADPPSTVMPVGGGANIKVDSSAQGIPAAGDPPRPSDAPKAEGVPQYKVLTQKDHSASTKFNALRLEEVLNEHAHKGWVVKSAVVMKIKSHAGENEEMILILEH